jgi:hypothetical protein
LVIGTYFEFGILNLEFIWLLEIGYWLLSCESLQAEESGYYLSFWKPPHHNPLGAASDSGLWNESLQHDNRENPKCLKSN